MTATENDEVSRAGESPPRALAESDVSLSPHPAPIVQPRPCKSAQWANSDGCRRATRAIQCAVCRRRRRKELNFRCAHRARMRSMWSQGRVESRVVVPGVVVDPTPDVAIEHPG